MSEGRVTRSAGISYITQQDTWLSALIEAKGDPCVPRAEDNCFCVYTLAIYWSVMTLTGVGYGDIVAQNPLEYVVSTLGIFITGYVWAYVVGDFASLLATMDPYGAAYRNNTEALRDYTDRMRVPRSLSNLLRGFWVRAKGVETYKKQRLFLHSYISDGLQREVISSQALMKTMLSRVYWAENLEVEALTDVIKRMEHAMHGPRESMTLRAHLVVISRGLAWAGRRVYKRGDVWGVNDVLLVSEHLLHGTSPLTLTWVETLCLDQASLVEVSMPYPIFSHRLRRAQVRTAAFRAFVWKASRRQKAKHLLPVAKKYPVGSDLILPSERESS